MSEKIPDEYKETKPELGVEAKEHILKTREVESKRETAAGINLSFVVQLKDDGSGIFKPASGEGARLRPEELGPWGTNEVRDSVKRGTYYKREAAAWLVDRALDLNLVPPTVIRNIDGEIGSLQEWVDGKEIFETGWATISKTELINLLIFDYIIWSSDRKDNNILVRNGMAVAIDNGLSFGDDVFIPYVSIPSLDWTSDSPPMSFYANESMPQAFLYKIDRFLQQNEKMQQLRRELSDLLPQEEVDACFARINHMAELGMKSEELSGLRKFFGTWKFNPKHAT